MVREEDFCCFYGVPVVTAFIFLWLYTALKSGKNERLPFLLGIALFILAYMFSADLLFLQPYYLLVDVLNMLLDSDFIK